MAKKKRPVGRPPKKVKEINRAVQFGRRREEDIALVDKAAAKAGYETRSGWAWDVLLREARRVLGK